MTVWTDHRARVTPEKHPERSKNDAKNVARIVAFVLSLLPLIAVAAQFWN